MEDWAQRLWDKWLPGKGQDDVKQEDFVQLKQDSEFLDDAEVYLQKRREAEFLLRPKKDRSSTISGAQLTLDNLEGTPAYEPRDFSDVQSSAKPPPINADGWLGIPDPNKYPPGTVRLTPEQLQEEIQAGRVISLADLQQLPWEEREQWLDQKLAQLQPIHEHAEQLAGSSSAAGSSHDRQSSGQGAGSRGSPLGGGSQQEGRRPWEQPQKGHTLQEKMSLLTFLLTKGAEDVGFNPAGFANVPKSLQDPGLAAFVVETWMKNFWIRLVDGTRISLFNLFRFVEDNPELEALAKRNLVDFQQVGEEEMTAAERAKSVPPWELTPNLSQMLLDPDLEARLNFGRAASRTITTLAPSFFNPHPPPDFSYAVFLHEEAAQDVLGERWGGRPARQVLNDPDFYEDLVELGPEMGATLMFSSHRELPWDACKDALADLVMQHVMKHEPQNETLQRAQLLRSFLDRERLADQTKLLTADGQSIREGASLLFNTGPDGQVMVQAISPGVLKDKEYYTLGTVADPLLAVGLLDTFMGPAVVEEAEDFIKELGMRCLFYTNGFKSRNADDNPHQQLHDGNWPFQLEVMPASTQVFALPPVGFPPFPTVVTNVTDAVAGRNMASAFGKAARAAWSVEGSGADMPARRRVAAESAFRRALLKMGMPVEQLLECMPDNMFCPEFDPEPIAPLPPPPTPLEAVAEPLQINAGSTA